MLGALVIDVRINIGGSYLYEKAISSRLATSEYLAYTIQARSDPIDRNKWTPGVTTTVQPSSRPGFRGPVVEWIGPYTLSAGETFTQALMGPYSARDANRREYTRRILRCPDPAAAQRVDLRPAQRIYRTADGTAFDGVGIPPDINVPVFADTDVAAGKDPAMEKAIQILGKH